MKRLVGVASAAVLTGALLVGCGSESGVQCASMGSVALMSNAVPLAPALEYPLPQKPGGGSGGGGGRGSSGGSKGGSSSGSKSGSSWGSKPSGGSSGSYGSSLPKSKPKTSYTSPVKPGGGQSYQSRGNYPGYNQPATYVRQPDGMFLPFIGGMLVGDALSSPTVVCD